MTMATTLKNALDQQGLDYVLLAHPHAPSALRTAEAAHIPGDRMVKSVILRDEQGLMMAVLPATHRVDLGVLHKRLGRKLGLATEAEFVGLINDCEPGAVPPVGPAYGIPTLVDLAIDPVEQVYLDAGDHYQLVQMPAGQFYRLLEGSERLSFSHHL